VWWCSGRLRTRRRPSARTWPGCGDSCRTVHCVTTARGYVLDPWAVPPTVPTLAVVAGPPDDPDAPDDAGDPDEPDDQGDPKSSVMIVACRPATEPSRRHASAGFGPFGPVTRQREPEVPFGSEAHGRAAPRGRPARGPRSLGRCVMTQGPTNGAAAGWYPDPLGRHQHRYFDGARWTSHVADSGPIRRGSPHAAATSTSNPPANDLGGPAPDRLPRPRPRPLRP
jgi:hypothetical protein